MAQSNGQIEGFVSEEIIFSKLIQVLDRINNDPDLKGNVFKFIIIQQCSYIFRLFLLAHSEGKTA